MHPDAFLAFAVVGVVVGSTVLGLVIALVIKGYRAFQASSRRRVDELCARYHVDVPIEGVRYVIVDFSLYWGFLNTMTTLHVVWWVAEDEALDCLSALLRFNLSRGVWGAGGLFVPFSSLFRYWRQRRAVQRGADAGRATSSRAPAPVGRGRA